MKNKRRPNRVSVSKMFAVAKETNFVSNGLAASVILNGNSADVRSAEARAELTATRWEGSEARPIEGCWQCPPTLKNSGSSATASIVNR